jgi:hypothetical protein
MYCRSFEIRRLDYIKKLSRNTAIHPATPIQRGKLPADLCALKIATRSLQQIVPGLP